MPETLTKEITVFDYDELTSVAKDKALDWFAQMQSEDQYWAEDIIDGAKDAGREVGFDIDDVHWSGFNSQGDGAAWSGRIKLRQFIAHHIKPDDPDIAAYMVIDALVADGWIGETVEVNFRSYYYAHSGNMTLGELDDAALQSLVYQDSASDTAPDTIKAEHPLQGADVYDIAKSIDYIDSFYTKLQERLLDTAREYADNIYDQLEEEYEYQTSEENFKECAYINGWRFDERGKHVS